MAKIPDTKLYRCEVCHKVEWWTDEWRWFGSLLDQENNPLDIPTLCSEKCQVEFEARMKAKLVQLPTHKKRYGQYYVDRERVGY